MLVRVGRLGMAPALRILTEAALGLGRRGTPERLEIRLDLLGVAARYARAPGPGDGLAVVCRVLGAHTGPLGGPAASGAAISGVRGRLSGNASQPGAWQVRSVVDVVVTVWSPARGRRAATTRRAATAPGGRLNGDAGR
jgi:hypothetical protein